MIKLFYSEGACSLSPHIILNEIGLPFEAVKVDWSGNDGTLKELNRLNDNGCVPTLSLDDGSPLTEGSAIVQYLADLKPEANLAPKAGTIERSRLQEHLNFIASELHKGMGAFFGLNEAYPDEAMRAQVRKVASEKLTQALNVMSKRLGLKEYVMGSQFTVADAYLFTVLSWAQYVSFDLKPWPNLEAHQLRIFKRPAVQKAMKTENLLG